MFGLLQYLTSQKREAIFIYIWTCQSDSLMEKTESKSLNSKSCNEYNSDLDV